ncbi:glutathione S-transferase [Labrys sp. LIt4]|uniref:glutathione S-transferase family protein n=1 Tax=Labrys sp. LIt4 TaxID=2821355 RepID=UPI001ADF2A78|nr:glutathione S-transferase [Labrys sp. LIt4]MBP0577939.1 glutathione S-transferase [Labrys sp. LIt4]
MLKIWGRRNSFNVQKVMWLVGELGIVHEHIPAGGDFGGLDRPEFLALNPHGRVPVIDDAGTIVWESHTILRYLAARFGTAGFWPDDAGERSLFERWMDWSQTALQPAFLTDVFWGFYRTPETQRDWPRIRRGIEDCSAYFRLLDHWLEGRRHMLGDDLSLADIAVGTTLYRYFNLDISRPEIPYVRAWYERLEARAPYRDHVMIPFDDLRGRLAF